jgi:peroxiredoxin Q/BCP
MADKKDLLTEGLAAPDFTAPSTEGDITLSALRGRTVVLYFYPKDDTPGCTREACAFRDLKAEMAALGAVVIGVSKDKPASHEKFKTKYGLNFPLVSDPDLSIHEAYGAWAPKTLYGKTALGVVRSTFVIDGAGVVRKAWRGVKVDGHDAKVLEVVRGLAS